MDKTEVLVRYFKTLSVPIRLRIIEILSCGELCACELLKGLSISQSTLSHHMKVLIQSDLVHRRKDATWVYYSINTGKVEELQNLIYDVTKANDNCICYSHTKKGRKCT